MPKKHALVMTERDRKAVKYFKQGIPKSKALVLAGFPESTARTPAVVFNKPAIKNHLEAFQAGLRQRIPHSRIYDKLDEFMDASSEHIDPRTGKVIKTHDRPTQIKGTELTMKALKYLTTDTTINNLNVSIEDALD